jgi:hypothetical protein
VPIYIIIKIVLNYNTRRVIKVENIASQNLENDGYFSGFNGVDNPRVP